jgi:hypothetical protein
MERAKQVSVARAERRAEAYERWRGYQLDWSQVEKAAPNRDGTRPRPRVAAITPEQRARYEERSALRATFESPAYRNERKFAERQIGATLDFVDLAPSEQAQKAGRPVAQGPLLRTSSRC